MKILEYHEIVAGQPEEIHAVSAQRFADQLAWLDDHGYQVVRLGEWIDPARRQSLTGQGLIAISFDDGYQDNYERAFPLLQARNYPATIFLVSMAIGKTSFWREGTLADSPMLTWEQVREMRQAGIEFGSHTLSHADLTRLDLKTVEFELRQSKTDIENHLGEPVTLFSYPFSQLNQEIKRLAAQAGYRAACTYQPFYAGSAGRDRFAYQRIGILANDTLEDFVQKINASLPRRLKWTRYRVRQFLRLLLRFHE
jgi:peptidoglycan/xylan/chitin deacetylase (PgdA/CDA1 family)